MKQKTFKKGDRIKAIKGGEIGTVESVGKVWMCVEWDTSYTNAKSSCSLGAVFTKENGNEVFELLTTKQK